MAMNDISVSISADKESFLAFKDSSLADSADESGTEFFTQLQDAHTTFEPIKKEINKPETDTLSAASADSPSVTNEKLNSDSDDEDIAQINLLSGSDILEQINSSQLMNTEVTKPSEKAKDINLADTSTNKTPLDIADLKEKLPVKGYVAVPAKDLPVKDEVGKVIASQLILADSTKIDLIEPENIKDISNILDAPKQLKSPVKEAFEVQINGKADEIKESVHRDVSLDLKDAKKHQAQNVVQSTTFEKDINSIKAGEVSVNFKLDQISQSDANTKTDQLKGEQLATIKQAIGELKVLVAKDANQSSDTKFTISQKAVNDSQKLPPTNESQIDKVVTLPVKGEEITKPATFVASQTPNTVNRPQKVSVKSGSENSADPTKLAAQPTSDEELTKALEQLQKEGLKNTTAEQSPAKVMQMFNHITNALNTTQTSAQSYYDSVDYEMGILDQQVIQNQQLQSTAQTKQVSIDPGMMQAINIVKSDSAKLLQERVSSMLSINNKEAEIRLDPPEMGSMQIRVRSDAEQAQINFVVQNQQAKEALEQSMPRLREMLAQQGLELGESTISYGQSGGENAEQNESGAGEQLAKNGAANSESDEPSNSPEQTSEQQTSSSIDYYA